MMRHAFYVLLLFSVAACTAVQPSAQAPSSSMSVEEGLDSNPAQAMLLTAIADAKIPAGECGFLLWTLDAERPLPIMKYVAGKRAAIALKGEAMSLDLTESRGASGFGVFEESEFHNDQGLRVSVSMEFGFGFDGGSYLQRGVISVERANGWRSVTPAAGIAGCRG